MDKKFDISSRLKELRKSTKLTQEEFAEHSQLSYKFYQHIESGRKKLMRVDTVERISRAYGIELWEFFHPKLPKITLNVKKNITYKAHNRRPNKDANLSKGESVKKPSI